jgi:hypothetical protein
MFSSISPFLSIPSSLHRISTLCNRMHRPHRVMPPIGPSCCPVANGGVPLMAVTRREAGDKGGAVSLRRARSRWPSGQRRHARRRRSC